MAALTLPLPNNPARYFGSESTNVPRSILPRPQKLLTPLPLGIGLTERQTKRPRTNVTVACDCCKQARAKCDGKQPCLRCAKRSLSCKYDQGNDRRQNRGSNEEVQALNDRLVQYQRFIIALRSSSPGNAGYALQRLRSPSTEAVTILRDSRISATDDVAFAAAVQLLNETKSNHIANMNLEETSALVGWIKQDLDTAVVISQESPPTDISMDQQGYNDVEKSIRNRASVVVDRLLC